MKMLHMLYVEISVIGVCLLLIILFNQHQNSGSSTLQFQFNRLIYATIAMLIVDTACWLLDGATFTHARIFKTAAETVYYIINILIPYLWVVYLEMALSKEQKATCRRLRILAIPLVLLIIFIFVNLYTHGIFIIDANNVYHRNSGFYVFIVAAYAYLGYASVRALMAARRAGWSEDKRRYYALAFFVVPPAIGGIIQTFVYGVSLIWVFVAISIMLMYIDSLNWQISADPLTGINNRRELTKYLLRETKDPAYGGILALIMMDVDNFKQINDSFGHYYGDDILVAVSEILKQSCKNSPVILARYGGDEFCIAYPAESIDAVEGIISKILRDVIHWNSMRNEPVSIGLSIGYSVWQPDTGDTVDDLFKRADQKMYQVKSAKKSI
ncbi:MAG: GGDEF domain-containing protein [Bacillota bacterium]